VGSVTAAPVASETGQGFGHTVTLRFPAGISHYSGDAPVVLRANQRRGADARSCSACHRGNFPFRPPRRDAKRLALHRASLRIHDVILASRKGEVNLASRKVNLASQATRPESPHQDVIFASR
jgi:hypothetical protein